MRILIFLVLLTAIAVSAYAQDNEITLTTYYPAPYGDYDAVSSKYIDLDASAYDTTLVPPATPSIKQGRIFYDAGTGTYKFSPDGTSWVELGGGAMGGEGFSFQSEAGSTVELKPSGKDYILEYTPIAGTPSHEGKFILKTYNADGITMDPYGAVLHGHLGANLTLNTTQGIVHTSLGGVKFYKMFVIEHPLDKEKLLAHACIEGPEAGVY